MKPELKNAIKNQDAIFLSIHEIVLQFTNKMQEESDILGFLKSIQDKYKREQASLLLAQQNIAEFEQNGDDLNLAADPEGNKDGIDFLLRMLSCNEDHIKIVRKNMEESVLNEGMISNGMIKAKKELDDSIQLFVGKIHEAKKSIDLVKTLALQDLEEVGQVIKKARESGDAPFSGGVSESEVRAALMAEFKLSQLITHVESNAKPIRNIENKLRQCILKIEKNEKEYDAIQATLRKQFEEPIAEIKSASKTNWKQFKLEVPPLFYVYPETTNADGYDCVVEDFDDSNDDFDDFYVKDDDSNDNVSSDLLKNQAKAEVAIKAEDWSDISKEIEDLISKDKEVKSLLNNPKAIEELFEEHQKKDKLSNSKEGDLFAGIPKLNSLQRKAVLNGVRPIIIPSKGNFNFQIASLVNATGLQNSQASRFKSTGGFLNESREKSAKEGADSPTQKKQKMAKNSPEGRN